MQLKQWGQMIGLCVWRTLRSRRVLIAIAALVVGALVMAVPELESVQSELLTLAVTLALTVIGGYSVVEAAAYARERNGKHNPDEDPAERLRDLIKEVLIEILDGMVDDFDEELDTIEDAVVEGVEDAEPTAVR